MSLEDGAHKDLLEDDYEQYRAIADQARENDDPSKAAKYYRECADVLRQIATLESSDRLSTERENLADNLEQAAAALDQHGSVDSVESDEEATSTSKTGSGGDDRSGSGGGSHRASESDADDDDAPDPDEYLQAPPEMDFDDVGGMTELKESLKDKVIDPLNRPELYREYDLGVVNGVLLYGPPGTGKTYITQALAGRLGYNFIEARAADLTSSLVGESAGNVAELFEVARANQPCLLFIDEIDAIAAQRSGGAQKTMSESQMITQFLTEMSEIKGEEVVVVAATNRPDDIDGAAWRRFDERIEVPPPDPTARAAVLRVHLRNRPVLTESIDWDEIKALTEGYSSSDLEIIAANAARKALKESRDVDEIRRISQEHLESAIDETASSLENWNG
ncbi:ATP-binding protein [Halobellus salinisoli]|uniref:ATP-binding protein n=1 Tax=Halobellus salinisoli TaxID=3108500 RepID=UPI00300A55D1